MCTDGNAGTARVLLPAQAPPPPPPTGDDKPPLMEWLLGGFETTNRNARLSVLYIITLYLSNGLLLSGTIALLFDELTHSLSKIGFAEGIFGFLSFVPGLVGGYFADKYRRDTIIRIGASGTLFASLCLVVLNVAYFASEDVRVALNPQRHALANVSDAPIPDVSTFLTSVSAAWDDGEPAAAAASLSGSDNNAPDQVPGVGSYMFFLTTVLIGIIMTSEGLSDTGYIALQADSLATGRRTKFLSKKQSWRNMAIGVGPLVMTIIFLTRDSWSVENLTLVVIIGSCVRLLSVCVMFCFNDDYSLTSGLSNAVTEARHGEPPREKGWTKDDLVPFIIVTARIVSALGSGMTVKFFVIFFKSKGYLDLPPTLVYLMMAGLPFLRALCTKLIHGVTERIGRAQSEILLWVTGVSGLAGIVIIAHTWGFSSNAAKVVTVCLYLLRCGLLQSTGFILSSVVNDYVPKNRRARFAAFQTLTTVGWTGSAAVGGVLAERYGYPFAFAVTTIFHCTAIMIKSPLLCLVPRKAVTMSPKGAKHGGNVQAAEGGSGDEEVSSEEGEPDETAPILGPHASKRTVVHSAS